MTEITLNVPGVKVLPLHENHIAKVIDLMNKGRGQVCSWLLLYKFNYISLLQVAFWLGSDQVK